MSSEVNSRQLGAHAECLPLFSAAQGVPAAWSFVHDGGAAKLSSGTGLHSSLAKSLFGSTSPEEGGEKCRRLRGHKRLRPYTRVPDERHELRHMAQRNNGTTVWLCG